MKWIINIIKYAFYLILTLFIIATVGGSIIRYKGQAPIDAQQLSAISSKLTNDKNGRQVEYFCYGSTKADAPVLISLHGSGLDGGFEKNMHQQACNRLAVRGVAISLPGCGNTDLKIGRKVIEWPAEDLAAVLQAEQIDSFMISGHSQGTVHAMAAALYYSERVTGLGLNAPLLPIELCHEFKLPTALGAESLNSTEQLQGLLNSYWFFVIYLMTDALAPTLPFQVMLSSGPAIASDSFLVDAFKQSLKRAVVRGSVGIAWESALDVCYEWGFDPRKINTNNICIWHPADDTACPPAAGAWLADFYSKKGLQVNFKNDSSGYNHFQFCNKFYRQPQHSMLYALLSQAADSSYSLNPAYEPL